MTAGPLNGAPSCFWRPQAALFVSERSLIPVLVALAPAASVLDRFPDAFAEVMGRLAIQIQAIDRELAHMEEQVLAKTASRSVLGVMNEFASLGTLYGQRGWTGGLAELSVELSRVPCGPLYGDHVTPDRATRALLA
jgi:hypothetical protein